MVRRKLCGHLSDTLYFENQKQKMEAAKAIRYGDAEALRYNEHQILYEIDLRSDDASINHEDYMTFWIASYREHEVATEMFEVFMSTCSTAFDLDNYEQVMKLYAWPALVGAISNQNIEILDYIKGYLDKKMIREEMYVQHGDEEDWPPALFTWYDESFS